MAEGHAVRPVWRNALGGVTYEVDSPGGRRFVKWAPAGSGFDLRAEMARLRWAVDFTPVPRVLRDGADPGGEWMMTAALPGSNAVADRWLADPRAAATAIGAGLRALHERLPVEGCPFSWSVQDRLRAVRGHVRRRDPARWHPDHAGLSPARAMSRLNGVADRWADLAVATWSLEWNYGSGWQPTLLEAYGVAPDPQRISYYRLLYDLSP